MLDIDYFKKYNDLHGHQRGDAILRKLGMVFNKHMRNTDKVYRYGGEEFAIICTETDRESAIICAERLRKVINEEKFEGEEDIEPYNNLTVSIGVSNFPFDATKLDQFIRHADNALYKAKAEGRNRVVA